MKRTHVRILSLDLDVAGVAVNPDEIDWAITFDDVRD